jgi:hypothetical protein
MGRLRYPDATRSSSAPMPAGRTATGSGLEGRARQARQETGLEITVCHYPPGTSKWNKIVLYTGFPGVYEVTNEAV